ncbi:MBL fold metallo-hydrolase [Rhizobiaceae bacterium]|nr:MBL fold metallo-hydrolase [Rhizobiaceae bacterium]
MLRLALVVTTSAIALAAIAGAAAPVAAQEVLPSQCLAIANNLHRDPGLPPVHFASFEQASVLEAQASKPQYTVTISYQGHSTYLIESPGGATIATDYAGWLIDPVVPLGVTMNQAHSSHWTSTIRPGTEHVMRGWSEDGTPAKHSLMVGDILVRNVATDLLRYQPQPNGNSIFIFEVAGLCIGHLGHLHHELSDDQYAAIGRLDVVMIPVDGGLTLTHLSAKELLSRLRSSVVLPMHVRAYGALPRFLSYLGDEFAVERLPRNRLELSLANLPKRPTVMLLPGVGSGSGLIDN